ncbi:MAG: hypothetical protein E6R11_03610 [Rhodocyclaceae bacterium]|jgi:hypothetical protein|nr:MAG: hypothetical protein E6R11_03610 [Rhodocyclaceae bacterium]
MLNRLQGLARRCLAPTLTALAFGATVAHADGTPRDLQVTFTDCTEFAGLTGVSRAAIAPLVPAGFTLADFGPDTAGAVVRVANCEGVAVDGSHPVPGTVAHIGANLVSPDGTGDINNYTLLYATDNPRLALRLRQFGLPVRLDPSIAYEVTPSSTQLELYASVQPGAGESWFLHGSETDPPAGSDIPFLANWWHASRKGRLRMSTDIPAIGFGTADVAFYTARNSDLGAVFNANRTTFPLLSVRGKFAVGNMSVTLAR